MADIRPMAELVTPKVEQLEEAKANVLWLLDHPNGLADMHGIRYWAGRVEVLREEIREHL